MYNTLSEKKTALIQKDFRKKKTYTCLIDRTGIACVPPVGSTGAATTIEYELGAFDGLRRALDPPAPARRQSIQPRALRVVENRIPILDDELQLVALNLDNRDRRARLWSW